MPYTRAPTPKGNNLAPSYCQKHAKHTALSVCLTLVTSFAGLAESIPSALHAIENELGARVGFFMRDLQTGNVIAHAGNDRFPVNSTFKLFACGALLARSEMGQSRLDSVYTLSDVDVVSYSPAINAALREGSTHITLDEACAMMLSVSDNTAANIVLSEIGGPAGMTAFFRDLGDQKTRLDRWEPMLNDTTPGDDRDTTTPRAITQALQKLILGDALRDSSRVILKDWLSKHQVSGDLFRAALPDTWHIEDRTGAGTRGARSIIAVLYPPGQNPLVAGLFMTETDAPMAQRNAAAARIGAAIVQYVQEGK